MPQRKPARRPPRPSQKKPPLTHFLCIPLVTTASKPQLEASIETFRKNVTSEQRQPQREESSGFATTTTATRIHPKAIRPVGTLHCTLGVMSLDKEKLDKAISLLKNLDISQLLSATASPTTSNSHPADPLKTTSTSTQQPPAENNESHEPLTISLLSLSSMHDPSRTSILYIDPLDPTQRLYTFSLALRQIFLDAEMLLPDNRELKLHATVVNTIYTKGGRKRPAGPNKERTQTVDGARTSGANERGETSKVEDDDDRSQGHGPNSNAPLRFDARGLLEEYKGYVWAEGVVLDRIAICEMGAKKVLDGDGRAVGEEYVEVARVGLLV